MTPNGQQTGIPPRTGRLPRPWQGGVGAVHPDEDPSGSPVPVELLHPGLSNDEASAAASPARSTPPAAQQLPALLVRAAAHVVEVPAQTVFGARCWDSDEAERSAPYGALPRCYGRQRRSARAPAAPPLGVLFPAFSGHEILPEP
ncbi:hypothetical protein [Nocardiopsis sp. CNT312]|uniref:hypothetical protein n=1 Tax=Nocardiopsis sp. CNT312 TaxID=1137268 RepID=UPI00048FA921|nr:hypothetical protein [Nocardiopsis sp. CNT312]